MNDASHQQTQETPAQPSGKTPHEAKGEVVSSNRLPTLAEQVRAEVERQKAEHRSKKGSAGAARGDDGRFQKEAEEEASAAREDGDGRKRRQSKAKDFDDAKAEAIEELEASGKSASEDEASEPDEKTEPQAEPKGSPKAARWRIKLKRGEDRLIAFQSQLSDQARQIADRARDVEARERALEAKAALVAEAEDLERRFGEDPLSLLYERKIDPETLTLRHYERVKAGTAGKVLPAATVAQLPPEVRKALDELAEVKAKLAEAEKAKETAAQAAQTAEARQKFLGLVTEEVYPDLDVYRDIKGDDDVIASAFGDDGAAYHLEVRLGRKPTPTEVLRELNARAASWLAERKIAKRYAGRTTPAVSDRDTEARPAPKPEGAKPISKTLSNRQVASVTPPRSPDFGSREDTTAFLANALRAGRK